MSKPNSSNFRIVMFPWFAIGHITPFLHLSNSLAQKGCYTSFLLPNKAIQQLQHFNLYPDLITFHSITVPPVDGLPAGAETASDIPINLSHLLIIALDRTRDQVEKIIHETKPNLVIFDVAHWIPEITKRIGIKAINYTVVSAASISIVLDPKRQVTLEKPITEDELAVLPSGYPSSTVVLRRHELRSLLFVSMPFGEGITFYERVTNAMKDSDALAFRSCQETEGKFCDFIAKQFERPVFLTGPVLPEPSKIPLEERWDKWLNGFEKSSVIFCAFGSQIILQVKQFQELVLGLEITGLPFFVALKPPAGVSTVEEALPEGLAKRIEGRGIVCGEWVQQLMILDHPSVGCFVNHCGFGSMWEGLMSNCQLVLVPNLADQILNTRFMAEELKVAIEVARDENGWFSKENLSKAIMCVMDKENEVGLMIKDNHRKWRETIVNQGLMSGYIDQFVHDMQDFVKET